MSQGSSQVVRDEGTQVFLISHEKDQAPNQQPDSQQAGDSDDMPLPPERSFKTIEDLRAFVHSWTLAHGYELTIESTREKRKLVRCGRAGKTRNTRQLRPQDRKRNTATKKSGCPVTLFYAGDEDGSWRIEHPQKYQAHNHTRLERGHGTASHRRFQRASSDDLMRDLRLYLQNGVSTRQVLKLLQARYPDSLQTSKDVLNVKLQIQREQIGTESSITSPISNESEVTPRS